MTVLCGVVYYFDNIICTGEEPAFNVAFIVGFVGAGAGFALSILGFGKIQKRFDVKAFPPFPEDGVPARDRFNGHKIKMGICLAYAIYLGVHTALITFNLVSLFSLL